MMKNGVVDDDVRGHGRYRMWSSFGAGAGVRGDKGTEK